MGFLSGTKAYLGGPVEASDSPTSWRNEMSGKLLEIGVYPLNPLNKPNWMPQIDGLTQRKFKDKVLEDKSSEIKEINQKIRKYCLALVRMSDFLIVKLDNSQTIGTFEELKMAEGKPVFIISDQEVPSMWLFDQLDLYDNRSIYMHRTIASCFTKICMIDFVGPDQRYLDPFKWIFLFNKNF